MFTVFNIICEYFQVNLRNSYKLKKYFISTLFCLVIVRGQCLCSSLNFAIKYFIQYPSYDCESWESSNVPYFVFYSFLYQCISFISLLVNYVGPVSYTHLDVYKRQILYIIHFYIIISFFIPTLMEVEKNSICIFLALLCLVLSLIHWLELLLPGICVILVDTTMVCY